MPRIEGWILKKSRFIDCTTLYISFLHLLMDTVVARGALLEIHLGEGDDEIDAEGNGATILGGAGNDLIKTYHVGIDVDGGADNDTIIMDNKSSESTAHGGEGDDTIIAMGRDSGVTGSLGNDTIEIAGTNSVSLGNEGNDTITSTGLDAAIGGGAGNDTILSYGVNANIDAGEGSDTIAIVSGTVTVQGGAGDDSMFHFENGFAVITDSSGTQDFVKFQSTVAADIAFFKSGNDLMDSSAADFEDGQVNTGIILQDFYVSDEHVDFIIGSDDLAYTLSEFLV
ncbi:MULTISPECIES: calcium-binding protein [unclassified Pseudovibrio]|uniref:calcium-binding protein n=1 Tax=unclassified Pseudovibrio TaxID=2627060 RepID=UPI0007B1F519|nr:MULTISPECIES: calcium-binding protein [unclassified Pseudovibrio]KZK98594.1 hypothetical protein PsW74_03183 [Pseudovibrio sp. W74]KZL08440.1 hypothetical protein PsAD14_03590 [Pseudovibrio sp. Ad14]